MMAGPDTAADPGAPPPAGAAPLTSGPRQRSPKITATSRSSWRPVARVAAERLHRAVTHPNIVIHAQKNLAVTKDGAAPMEKGALKSTELPVFSVDLHEAARRSESEVSEWASERLDEAIQRYRKFFHLASLVRASLRRGTST